MSGRADAIGQPVRPRNWGWASLGAAWIEPALWLLWLIAHGHTAEQA
ncbi:hypothetical protein [Streptomyces sp. NPDC051452]